MRKGKLGGVTGKGWKPGQSGNPGGKFQKQGMLTRKLIELLETAVIYGSDGRINLPPITKKNNYAEVVVAKTLSDAIKGNNSMMREVWERIDGRVPLKTELEGLDKLPVRFTFEIVPKE